MKKFFAVLTLAAAASAALHIWAEYFGPPIQIYIFKPLTMFFIILIAISGARGFRAFYPYGVLAGLLFSIAGDVFLMLPGDYFTPGLASFLVAHLFYIAAFTKGTRLWRSPGPILLFALYGLVIYIVLHPHLGAMKGPVALYIIVIILMGWRACERRLQNRDRSALLAFLGAILFIISDTILALDRFREHFEVARVLSLCTYFSAQWLIALSVDKARGPERS